MKRNGKKSTRMILTLPAFRKSQLEEIAKKYECSQALVLRTALIRMVESTK
jgi:hypothetical protein